MEFVRSGLLLIGLVAFFSNILLKLSFAKETNLEGTTKWKLKNILWIIVGFCIFLVLGASIIFVPLQENREPLYFLGAYCIIFGVGVIWNSLNNLLGKKTKWTYSLYIFGGTLLIISQLLSLRESIQSSEKFYLISRETVSLLMGIFIIIYSVINFNAFTQKDADSSNGESIETQT